MITTYFILNKRDNRPWAETYYIKITAESQQTAKDVFMMKYKQGHAGVFSEDTFRPLKNYILYDTLIQIHR